MFHGVFTKQQSSGSCQNEMNRKSKNTVKNKWDFVGIYTCDSKCVSVCVYMWVIVTYYCVCMWEWYIMHVYVKVNPPRVVFTGC